MIPVVISGGSGTRLWPVSRSSYPKQFCEFYDKSFLQNSVERVRTLGEPVLLTVESMRSMTMRLVKEAQINPENLICEPFGKNTAPAIALLCHHLKSRGKQEEVVGVFPADHLIVENEKFLQVVKFAETIAQKGLVVTLGIEPRFPATGYGYIEVGAKSESNDAGLSAFSVKQFCEKPNKETAEKFVSTGVHYWNSGMFIFKISAMIQNFEKLMPDLWQRVSKIEEDFSNAKHVYANLEGQSIDYGIMEKLDELVCIPSEMGWSDVGSWDELARIAEELPDYRADSKANLFNVESASNYVFALKEKVVGLIGVRNLIVVDTPDALLVSQKGESEKVREVVKSVQEAGLPEATDQKFEVRPWGMFEVLSDAENYKAKRILVDPGAQLSEQSHEKRSEHWVIIEGEGEVTLDGKKTTYRAGEHIFIPQQSRHRIKNSGSSPLVFVEVQTGSYFGEDDIKRYDDDYNRV